MRANSNGKKMDLYFATRGGEGHEIAYYNENQDLWWCNGSNGSSTTHYNLFGVDPDFDSYNPILLQINYQKEFKSFHDAAFWATDSKGRVYLMHNGKMGGGVRGFTYENIDYLFNGTRKTVIWKGKDFESYVVCELTSTNAYYQVVNFIMEVQKVKNEIKGITSADFISGKKKKINELKNYSPEFWGKRKAYLRNDKVESDSDHGFIVDSLKKELEKNFGLKGKLMNNKLIDLGYIQNGKPKAIFEIKSGTSMYSIYTAIGQLMLHAHNLKTAPHKYIVLPDDLDAHLSVGFGFTGRHL